MTVDLGAGLGLRQGECFGLAVDDVDFLRGVVRVQRQVKKVRGKHVFALPKYDKVRDVPLSESVKLALAEHLRRYPSVTVTLPWDVPGGPAQSHRLVVSAVRGGVVDAKDFNKDRWKPALRAVGVPCGSYENGASSVGRPWRSLDTGTVAARAPRRGALVIYLDSPALVKLIREEDETVALVSWLNGQPDQRLVASALVEVDGPRALRRSQPTVLGAVATTLARIDRIEIVTAIRTIAATYTDPHLRSPDAIHLATADHLVAAGKHVTAFVTYETRLAGAARTCGLPVIAPARPAGPAIATAASRDPVTSSAA